MRAKALIIAFVCMLCSSPGRAQNDIKPVTSEVKTWKDIKTGADQTDKYLSLLKNKAVAFTGNQTAMIGKTHLVDTLLALKVNLKKVFFPEHGFRGNEDNGAEI